jgi:hypothetical protein
VLTAETTWCWTSVPLIDVGGFSRPKRERKIAQRDG